MERDPHWRTWRKSQIRRLMLDMEMDGSRFSTLDWMLQVRILFLTKPEIFPVHGFLILRQNSTGLGYHGFSKLPLSDYQGRRTLTEVLIANDGYQAITIPTCIENGQYLLRAELIALHAGEAYPSHNFYRWHWQLNSFGYVGCTILCKSRYPWSPAIAYLYLDGMCPTEYHRRNGNFYTLNSVFTRSIRCMASLCS